MVDSCGSRPPFSMRAIAGWLIPVLSATCCWVIFAFLRSSTKRATNAATATSSRGPVCQYRFDFSDYEKLNDANQVYILNIDDYCFGE